ncbi:MAGa7180 family putative nuclease [Mycoplasmopsis agassizii]|uniref:YqaJ viral recombinase domain-containing protein n=1 Tax=Mycoplasmopsis agassizii TaxID=33922 RepID=A0ABX4H6E0_9BACT|nr:YqaJ viral recombinase family protein [Mycoplasmopsis agassizii]PAF55470.1 hypothetical protein CJF60_02180 [Mycoplasmopsis agassizii]SMC18927.1 YqaJ-like recombinase domain-containing protein [Mycoplasmopsis agassizii]
MAKRKYYNNRDYFLDRQNQVVRLSSDLHDKLLNKKLYGNRGFKKVTGSRAGNVLNVGGFASQFAAFCDISQIGLPMLDSKYVNAGTIIEPKVTDYLRTMLPDQEIETYDPMKYNFDYFADKDDVIGGIPDGYIKDQNVIIEIKTTGAKNIEKWKKGEVPESYIRQAQLYSYLMKADMFWIVSTFLNEDDYLYPEKFDINQHKSLIHKYKVNHQAVANDVLLIKEWYKKYTLSGVSPKFDLFKDKDLIDFLECSNEEEYEQLIRRWKSSGKAEASFENV